MGSKLGRKAYSKNPVGRPKLLRNDLDNWDRITSNDLAKVIEKVVKALNQKDLQKEKASSLAVMLGVSVDKLRLLRGQSTSNIAVVTREQGLEQLARMQEEIQKIEKKLGMRKKMALPDKKSCLEDLEVLSVPAETKGIETITES